MIDDDEARRVARRVCALVAKAVPGSRLEVGECFPTVRMRYDCPCGEVSTLQVMVHSWTPPEQLADSMVRQMRAHVISEGNTPNF